jgi:hypothetical protein
MAALMVVAVMVLAVSVFVTMDRSLVAVLLPVVDMGLSRVGVLVLMLVFTLATHVFPLR